MKIEIERYCNHKRGNKILFPPTDDDIKSAIKWAISDNSVQYVLREEWHPLKNSKDDIGTLIVYAEIKMQEKV